MRLSQNAADFTYHRSMSINQTQQSIHSLQTLSFKESESDCLHMLALTLFGLSDLPLSLNTPAVWKASIVYKQSLSHSSP